MKIGLVHISSRVDAIAWYVEWGLRRMGHEVVACFEKVDVDKIVQRPNDCDVYVRIEDSGAYETPALYRPLIYWCGDTHISDGVDRKAIAAAADYTFVAQKNAVGDIGDEWLPHAAWFFPEKKSYGTWLSSVLTFGYGNPLFKERCDYMDWIRARQYRRTRFETQFHHRNMERLYADSLMVWNHSLNNDVTMRHFESAACGCAIVCSRVKDNGLEECFGDLPVQYESAEELFAILDRAQHKDGYDDMMERGRELRRVAEQRHSYRHRLERIVEKAQELT